MKKIFLEAYEKINECRIISFINNKELTFDKKLLQVINKDNILFDIQKNEDLNNYIKNPNIKDYEYLIKRYQTNLTELSKKDIKKIHKYIKKNISYFDINKKQIVNINLDNMINNNELYKNLKNKIKFHLNTNIKGYRTIYLPIKKECHIFGSFCSTLKDFDFIFHELGHCFQLLITNEIILDTKISECYACINEILMSKNTLFYDFVIKSINNKILESICVFDFYNYLYKQKEFKTSKLENKWKKLTKKYKIKYKKGKWLTDYNSIENPQDILSYTIAYLIALTYKEKSYIEFTNICKSNITLNNIINNF